MDVKPAERRAEKSFPLSPGELEVAVDRSQRQSVSTSIPVLQKISEKIGRFVALIRASVLQALGGSVALSPPVSQKVGPGTSTSKLTPAYIPTAVEIAVTEITRDRSVQFTNRDLSTVFCIDLDKFSIEEAAVWTADARRANRLLPQIVVVAPQRRLSNNELKFISEEIAPVAVFIDRPDASFNDVLRSVRERITNVLEPKRLTVETSFEAVREAHRLIVPGG